LTSSSIGVSAGIDAFGALLEQFVDLQAMQIRESAATQLPRGACAGDQIEQRIIRRRLGEPVQRLLQQRMRGRAMSVCGA
jgi:hypothetical protein